MPNFRVSLTHRHGIIPSFKTKPLVWRTVNARNVSFVIFSRYKFDPYQLAQANFRVSLPHWRSVIAFGKYTFPFFFSLGRKKKPPLCNRPSDICILTGFSETNVTGSANSPRGYPFLSGGLCAFLNRTQTTRTGYVKRALGKPQTVRVKLKVSPATGGA